MSYCSIHIHDSLLKCYLMFSTIWTTTRLVALAIPVLLATRSLVAAQTFDWNAYIQYVTTQPAVTGTEGE